MKYYITILSLLIVSGCASWGNSDYGCTGHPQGVTCVGTRQLYEATDGGVVPVKSMLEQPETLTDYKDVDNVDNDYSTNYPDTQIVKQVQKGHEPTFTDPVIDTFVTPNLPDRPVPVRTPAQVMRIWVSTWEDAKSGALIAPGYIYTEIEKRKWVIGKPESAASQYGRIFKPLEPSSKATQ